MKVVRPSSHDRREEIAERIRQGGDEEGEGDEGGDEAAFPPRPYHR